MTNTSPKKQKRPTLTSMTAFALKLTEQASDARQDPHSFEEPAVRIPSGRIIQAIRDGAQFTSTTNGARKN